MKKILISVFSIAIVGAVAFGATRAFFSDTETSTGNVLAAGAIDLQIDNTSYVTSITGVLVASPDTSWVLRDLTIEKFFDFNDLKPGDIGEDTISLHVNNNDAWICAAARVTDNSDQSCTEPELANDPACTDPGLGQGDLAGQVNFAFWADDGDNVYEQQENIFLQGPISGLGQAGQIALADSTHNVWGTSGVVTGGQTKHIGKAWCFGTLTPAAVTQGEGTPLIRGTGFTCNGSTVNNAAQTDKVIADLQFYAVQSRNNAQFNCATNYTPAWPEKPITRVDRTQDGFGDGGWAGWSCPAGTIAVGGGIDSSTHPVGGNGVAASGAPAVDGFNYPVYPHYTFTTDTGYVVHDLADGLGNTISFHIDCQAN